MDAQRNLAETIKGIHISSSTTVRNFELESDSVCTKVEAFIRGAVVTSEQSLPDGSYEVVVRANLNGRDGLTQALLPAALAREKARPRPEVITLPSPEGTPSPKMENAAATAKSGAQTEPAAAVTPADPPAAPPVTLRPTVNVTAAPPDPPQVGPFSSVIVDCRGLGLPRAMSPKIVDTTGKEVWGTLQIDPDIVIERGLVGYYHSVEEAQRGPRAGNHPFLVKAVGKAGHVAPFQPDAVVTPEDGRRIVEENAKAKFLDDLNVCFVTD